MGQGGALMSHSQGLALSSLRVIPLLFNLDVRGDQETKWLETKYMKEEDQRILQFVRGKSQRVNGNQLWREAEDLDVTKSCKMSNSNPY